MSGKYMDTIWSANQIPENKKDKEIWVSSANDQQLEKGNTSRER